MSAPPLPSPRRDGKRVGSTVWRLVPRSEVRCDHLHDSTTRYDRAAKRLDFLLVCPVCETEKLIHSLEYEPCFEPTGATVLTLRPGEQVEAARRAA